MATISFKSVGKTPEKKTAEVTKKTPLPIGIKTPLQLSGKDGLLVMHYELDKQLSDNLKNLILTNWGERLGQYYFGANLRPLTVEFSSQEDFDNEAVVRIRDAVTRWMPFIDLVDFLSEVDRINNKSTGVINITITYNIPAININGKKLLVTLYVI